MNIFWRMHTYQIKENDHDSAEKIQETAKATFKGTQAQSNFRNYFAANNYSMFSTWNYVVLNCLKSVFPTYQNFPTMSLSLEQEKTKLYLCQMFLAKDKWNLKYFL